MPGRSGIAPRGAASEVVGVRRSVLVLCGTFSPPCFGTMVWADFLGARDCHVTRPCPSLGIASRTPITLPANSPCTILIRAGNVVRDDLTVDIPPLRRTPTARGRTGWMVDRPRPAFKGGGRVWLLATRPIVSDPRDGDVSPAGDRKLGRRHRSDLCQVCASSARFAAVSLAHLPRAPGHRSSSLCEPSHRPNAPRMTGSRA